MRWMLLLTCAVSSCCTITAYKPIGQHLTLAIYRPAAGTPRLHAPGDYVVVPVVGITYSVSVGPQHISYCSAELAHAVSICGSFYASSAVETCMCPAFMPR
jgi:hypothetical protein